MGVFCSRAQIINHSRNVYRGAGKQSAEDNKRIIYNKICVKITAKPPKQSRTEIVSPVVRSSSTSYVTYLPIIKMYYIVSRRPKNGNREPITMRCFQPYALNMCIVWCKEPFCPSRWRMLDDNLLRLLTNHRRWLSVYIQLVHCIILYTYIGYKYKYMPNQLWTTSLLLNILLFYLASINSYLRTLVFTTSLSYRDNHLCI